jgi:hypothetical protein
MAAKEGSGRAVILTEAAPTFVSSAASGLATARSNIFGFHAMTRALIRSSDLLYRFESVRQAYR